MVFVSVSPALLLVLLDPHLARFRRLVGLLQLSPAPAHSTPIDPQSRLINQPLLDPSASSRDANALLLVPPSLLPPPVSRMTTQSGRKSCAPNLLSDWHSIGYPYFMQHFFEQRLDKLQESACEPSSQAAAGVGSLTQTVVVKS